MYNVTPATGSTEGGTRITVHGKYFDETDAPLQVSVGGNIPISAFHSSLFSICTRVLFFDHKGVSLRFKNVCHALIGEPCEVVEFDDNYIVCDTSSQPGSVYNTTYFPGIRFYLNFSFLTY